MLRSAATTTGYALTSTSPAVKGTTKALLARLIRGYIGKHWRKLTVAMIAMAVIAATTAAYAQIMQPLTDLVFVNRDATGMIVVPLTFLSIAVIKAVATYIQTYLMGVFGQRIIADVQNSLFAHIIRADNAFFHATAKHSTKRSRASPKTRSRLRSLSACCSGPIGSSPSSPP